MDSKVVPNIKKVLAIAQPGPERKYIKGLIETVESCGHFIYCVECKSCSCKHFSGYSRCKSRHCIPCSRTKSIIWLARIMPVLKKWMDDGNYISMLNFSIRDSADLDGNIKKLYQTWRNFNHDHDTRKIFKDRLKGGLRSLEVKIGANSGLWHPHLHCMVMQPGGEYEKDYYWIKSKWESLTGDDTSVWIKKVSSSEDLLKSVCETLKYIIKPDVRVYDDAELYKQLILTLRGVRQVNTWGLLRGLTKDDVADYEAESDKKLADFVCRLCGCSEGTLQKYLFNTIKDEVLYDISL